MCLWGGIKGSEKMWSGVLCRSGEPQLVDCITYHLQLSFQHHLDAPLHERRDLKDGLP